MNWRERVHSCSLRRAAMLWGSATDWSGNPAPGQLDMPIGAPYGVESEVHRTRDALTWVAAHTPDDCETRALVARIEPRKNGRMLDPVEWEAARGR